MDIFYDALAGWWPLISPVEDYQEEAHECVRVLKAAHPSAQTLLELGSGGGHNAYYMKSHYRLTLTDLSPSMLRVSEKLNPDCEHVTGDMRSLNLDRTFDIVFAHDAVDYMTTEADLIAAISTAYRHCRPGGVALFLPDAVAGSFEMDTDCGGRDASDGRGVRYLEWNYDSDPSDTWATTQYVFIVRDLAGEARTYAETHNVGLFARETWLRLLEAAGFQAEARGEETSEDRRPRLLFLARRPPIVQR